MRFHPASDTQALFRSKGSASGIGTRLLQCCKCNASEAVLFLDFAALQSGSLISPQHVYMMLKARPNHHNSHHHLHSDSDTRLLHAMPMLTYMMPILTYVMPMLNLMMPTLTYVMPMLNFMLPMLSYMMLMLTYMMPVLTYRLPMPTYIRLRLSVCQC